MRVPVSILIATYNRASLLQGCLDRISRQTKRVGEIVVIENGNDGQTVPACEPWRSQLPGLRVIREEQPGKSRSLNTGLRSVTSEYVAILDDDALPRIDWFEKLGAAIEASGRAVIVGGCVHPVFDEPPPDWVVWTERFDLEKTGFVDEVSELRMFCGQATAFRREELSQCGGFREDLGPIGSSFRVGEDTEAVLRVHRKFRSSYYDSAICVEHRVPKSKLSLGYKLRRFYEAGIASSQLSESKLLSKRCFDRVLRRLGHPPASPTGPRADVRSRLVTTAFFLGRVRGARVW